MRMSELKRNVTPRISDGNEHNEKEDLSLDRYLERLKKFSKVLAAPVIDTNLSWKGVPSALRPVVWKILLGYLPANAEFRDETVARKRKEYESFLPSLSAEPDEVSEIIDSDLPRTFPHIPFLHTPRVHGLLRRVLRGWALRHPATSYVQGLSDILAVVLIVFIAEQYRIPNFDESTLASLNPETLFSGEDYLSNIEADCYWCLSRLLENIQDFYTFSQPGIQRSIRKIKEIIENDDQPLCRHLEDEGVQVVQFSFRWLSCLFVRDLPLTALVRLWDTYFAVGLSNVAEFHTCACAAFLLNWSTHVRELSAQDLLSFLLHLPTQQWGSAEAENMTAVAYILYSRYKGSHLQRSKSKLYYDL